MSLHYNGAYSYLFVNGTEIYKFKVKDSEIVATPLYLGNISKLIGNFSRDNMKKTGLNGYAYDFSFDYDPIAVDDILDIHGKEQYKMMLGFIKKCFFIAITFFSYNTFNVNSLEYVSMNNQ